MIRKIFRYFLFFLLMIIGMILIFILASIVPIDRTPVQESEYYNKMKETLHAFRDMEVPDAEHGFMIGFAKESIMPEYRTSLAGIGLRKLKYDAVHDSVFCRTMVITNGATKVALVSLDMLIVPPSVTHLLEKRLPAIGFSLDNTYLSATHTHNSLGNWGDNLVGRLYSGPYDDALVTFITERIIQAIIDAEQNMLPSTLKAGVIPAGKVLYNRLIDESRIDSLLRVIEVIRSDSSKLMLTSFTGHPTCAGSRTKDVSRDYPGVLVDELEANGYTFAMFMAGAVGSHGCRGMNRGWPMVQYVGEFLASAVLSQQDSLKRMEGTSLVMIRTPLSLGEPQFKISKDWRARPWLFNRVFGEYPSFLTALRIGDVVLLGTPCDFSGELTHSIDSVASKHGLQAMVMSFNGGYIGYITADQHYDIDHYETRLMNWYGPGNGAYMTECLMQLTTAVAN